MPPPSNPQARAKTAVQRNAAKGGKAGNPGNFTGEPLAYLQSLLKDYNTLQAQADERGKIDRLENFWARLRETFWAKFKPAEFRKTFKETDDTALVTKVNKVSSFLRESEG